VSASAVAVTGSVRHVYIGPDVRSLQLCAVSPSLRPSAHSLRPSQLRSTSCRRLLILRASADLYLPPASLTRITTKATHIPLALDDTYTTPLRLFIPRPKLVAMCIQHYCRYSCGCEVNTEFAQVRAHGPPLSPLGPGTGS